MFHYKLEISFEAALMRRDKIFNPIITSMVNQVQILEMILLLLKNPTKSFAVSFLANTIARKSSQYLRN